MLAATVDRLPAPDACRGGCGYEPKWDGWRALLFRDPDRVQLQSRSGRPLGGYFPEVTRIGRVALPAGTVLDGELLVWDADRGHTSFVALQQRIGGGPAPRLAARYPAHFVAFDLLQAPGGTELLDRPLAQRRARLADVLAGAPGQFALCPQTTDPDEARDWYDNWPAAGVEGLVIKGLATPYRPGQRGWLKLRHRRTAEAVAGGVTGTLSEPETVLVGRFDPAGRLRYAGRTHPLTPRQRRELAALLVPTARRRTGGIEHPWPVPLPAGWSGRLAGGGTVPLAYQRIQPTLVVEVSVDAAYEHHRWRHRPTYVRARTDRSVYDVPLATEEDGG
jgi:ATP-dependent DNA ligase